MASTKLPAYTIERRLAGGRSSFYWQLPTWARPPAERNGITCPVQSTALGDDKGRAIQRADALNEALAEWRKGIEVGPTKGTVHWLFGWYRRQDRFTTKSHKTRRDYGALMDMLGNLPTKDGKSQLGKVPAARITAATADQVYARLREKGERQASYAMQVCRLVWTWAVRHHRTTGITENPFAGMGLKSVALKGNRATTRAEYDVYRATARAMGRQSMATAAALAFECCQRTWDVFGFADPDGVKHRGFLWADYRPGDAISLRQSKTGNPVVLPLTTLADGDDGPFTLLLYPELMAELARSRQSAAGETIVLRDGSGQPYSERHMSTVHRAICDRAGLPKEMTFTGFRHGGITEVGSVDADVRPISGHATLDVTRIYNKATAEKARQIAAARRGLVDG